MADTGLSAADASLFTTASLLTLGLWSPLVPRLGKTMAWEQVTILSLGLILLGCLVRIVGSVPGVMAGSILAGIGIALGNVLIPILVKRDFPDRVPFIMGLCTMCICSSAAIPTAMTLPMANVLGGWPQALALWAFLALFALLLWIPRWTRRSISTQSRPSASVWRKPLAWHVAMFMGLQSVLAYSILGWFVALIRDRGLGPDLAGLVLGVSFFIQLPAALWAPALATRGRDQRPAIVVAAALLLSGMMGMIFAPLGTIWLWAVVLGLGQGALFALALTLISLRSATPAVAAELSSMSQATGYVLAASGPFIIGLIRQSQEDSWAGVALFLTLVTIACVTAGMSAGRHRVLA